MKKMVSILICTLALMVGHIQAQEVELTKEEKESSSRENRQYPACRSSGSYQCKEIYP